MRYTCAYLLFFVGSAISANPVTVVTMQLELGRNYDIYVNNTVEYILEFTPSVVASAHRVRVSSDGGDVTHPLLVVVRHSSGSRTLQLPYYVGPLLLHALQHTLCADDSAPCDASAAGDCGTSSLSLSLHVWTWCARSLRVSLSVEAVDLLLPPELTTEVTSTISAAAVRGYKWGPGEENAVLLRVDSDDDVCATIAILDYKACPIEESLSALSLVSTRFTMLQIGGVHLPRSRFPSGFLLVAIVHPDEAVCAEGSGADAGSDDLWQDAVLGGGGQDEAPPPHQRTKTLRYTIMPAISPAQYAVAAASTLAALALFYLAFFGLVMAQRIPAFYKYVAPQKLLVMAPENGMTIQSQIDGSTAAARSRRLSTATFDSSDNSDTDEDEDATSSPGAVVEARSVPRREVRTQRNQTDDNHSESVASEQHATTVQPSDSPSDEDAERPEQIVMTSLDHTSEQNGNIARSTTTDHNGQPQDTSVDQMGRSAEPAAARAFGLPPRLRLAALARRRERTLRARSRRYLHALLTVAVFYALPVLQLVTAFQLFLNASGSLDVCYYNFLCALPAGVLSDFNHVLSNVAYLLLGALLLLIVRRRQRRRRESPPPPDHGIPEHFGLMEALGAGMMMVALLSAAYHVCPNRLNFQFDTAFMYVLAVVSNVKMYQSRHPDVNARAHATFGVLAVIIAFGVWGVLGGGALFWGLWTVIHVFSSLMLSLRVYYVGQFRLGAASLEQAAATIRSGGRPLYATRLAALVVANAVNWAFALYGLVTQLSDFAGHLLSVLLCNALLHMCYYLGMKLASGERLRWYSVALTAGASAAWAPALYLFVSGSSDWSTTAARSRLRNHTCLVLQFYDAHDLWHLLSAVALFLSFVAMLTWDDGLAAKHRDDIHVF